MTEPNPFTQSANQFGQPAQAPATPQFGAPAASPAPSPQFGQPAPAQAPQFAAPQAPVTSPQFGQPAAPAAAPVSDVHVIRPADNALNPATLGIEAFGKTADTSVKLRTDLGQPILIRIHEIFPWRDQQGQEKEVASVDWVVLDGTANNVRSNARIFNAPVVRDLKQTLSQDRKFHVGRVIEVQSKHPQPALALGPLSEEEQTLAVQTGQHLGWF